MRTVLLLVLGVFTRQKLQINGSVVLGFDESPWPCGTPSWYTPLSWMILSKQKNLHLFSSQYDCVFLLRRLFVHGLFVSWGSPGWRFIINSQANVHVTIDCSTVLTLVLGVFTRQKLHINGSVVLGIDESPWPCETPSWYTPLSWMILSKQKNLHLFSSQNDCVFPLRRPSRIPCLLCSAYSSDWIHLIFLHLIKQLQKVCRVSSFVRNCKNVKFWQVFKICNLDFVSFWLGIWCESLVWVIMGRRGVSQNQAF